MEVIPQPSALHVLRAGAQTTVQDAGRRVRALGIPAGGAADPVARRLANALVGNPAGAAGLEVALSGPVLRFGADALVSLCGAPFDAELDGRPLPLWRAVTVAAGQTLSIGGARRGLRAFLAVRGGLEGQEVYGSRSTDLRGGFGGLEGRALRAGDVLRWAPLPHRPPHPGRVGWALHTPTGSHHPLRVVATADATPALLVALTGRTFTVSGQVDRMGARLSPAVPIPPALVPHDPARVSLPNVPGMVQLPPDGQPIVLLPDAGTHGGYPTPLVVASVDLPRLGQLRPGDTLSFHAVTPPQARTALQEQDRALRSAEGALRWWFGQG